jgi:hypothetical protein
MFNKYVMRNRTVRQWLSGATLFQNGCELAGGILSIVASGLRFFG